MEQPGRNVPKRESTFRLLRDARSARREGARTIDRLQRGRFAHIIEFARANSPYFRRLYRDLPDFVNDPRQLPITRKQELMAHFDDWATDRDVTMDQARAFTANPDLIGDRFLGKYTLATTSGTTGSPGIFLLDDRTLAVTNVLALRLVSAWLGVRDVIRIIRHRGRTTMICATGGHYAEAVAAARLRRGGGLRARAVQVLSAHAAPETMVAALVEFQPGILVPYASVGALLASEQASGRLNIDPALVVLSAEGLPVGGYDRISRAFSVLARHSYAATECTFISYSCDQHWLHVNADWVILEPVDADYRPVAPGESSHTTLITNLANRLQPILRYDIGDSIVWRSDACPCGNLLPAIRVQGRSADVLTFATNAGDSISIPALMFEIVDAPGIELFQILQVSPLGLRVRLRLAGGVDPEDAWAAVRGEIGEVLSARGLSHVTVERAQEPPQPSEGGKYRVIIPLPAGRSAQTASHERGA